MGVNGRQCFNCVLNSLASSSVPSGDAEELAIRMLVTGKRRPAGRKLVQLREPNAQGNVVDDRARDVRWHYEATQGLEYFEQCQHMMSREMMSQVLVPGHVTGPTDLSRGWRKQTRHVAWMEWVGQRWKGNPASMFLVGHCTGNPPDAFS